MKYRLYFWTDLPQKLSECCLLHNQNVPTEKTYHACQVVVSLIFRQNRIYGTMLGLGSMFCSTCIFFLDFQSLSMQACLWMGGRACGAACRPGASGPRKPEASWWIGNETDRPGAILLGRAQICVLWWVRVPVWPCRAGAAVAAARRPPRLDRLIRIRPPDAWSSQLPI